MSNYGLNKYKQTSVTTASRGQILLMLYEGAIKHCRIAIEATKAKRLADKGMSILKVQDIVNELSITLDHSVGGEISKELERLYSFIIDQITQANLTNDHRPLENALKILETLHEGWQTAVNQVSKAGGDAATLAANEKTPTTPTSGGSGNGKNTKS